MKKRLLFILVFSFIAAVAVSAQTRTVTNDDLEKYRQKRLAAEKDLRENYERLGFPSPEELERQIEQSRADRAELAERLRTESLERERLILERQRVANEARNSNYQTTTENFSSDERGVFFNYGYAPNGFYNFPNFGFPNKGFYRGNRRHDFRRNYQIQPRVEYRNNLPVLVQPPPQRIRAPR